MPAAAICQTAPSTSATTCWTALVPHRGALVRYARQRLQDPALAEDLVHDVFEAVVTGHACYAGRAALRTWLIGILKHKIVDLVRQRARWASLDAGDGADVDCVPGDQLECPLPRPDEMAAHRERLAQILERISRLPESLRPAVELRLLQDADSQQVCRTLGLTRSNLFVRLHRARQRLLV